jgi:phage terminase large subunit-like protein
MSTVIYNAEGRPLLYVPDAFAGQATKLLRYVNAATTSDPATRIRICRREPLIFALVYFPHKLRSEQTKNRYSLNPLHIFLAESAATYWPFPLEHKEVRIGIVAPRESGKTTWERILPIWGAAYGWRMFCAFFGASKERAQEHLANIRHELDNNTKLREDFPELCTPLKRNGKNVGDSKEVYRAASGAIFMARGITAENLGLNELDARPDLIFIDDVEPLGKYSPQEQDSRRNIIINGILPMSTTAAVYLIGTVVRYGSLMHEVAQADTGSGIADWIKQENFQTKYWPAYYRDARTGEEVSFWPEKWSMDFIRANRRYPSFQLGWMNQPAVSGAGLFLSSDLHYGFPYAVAERVLTIDPAVTIGEKSDFTGITVTGADVARRHTIIEYARGVKLEQDRLRELLRLILRNWPNISTIIVERNNGGMYVVNAVKEILPRGVKLLEPHERENKIDRIRELHDWCRRKWVFLGADVHPFVTQALAFPEVQHDDVLDAGARGAHHFLQHREIPRAG